MTLKKTLMAGAAGTALFALAAPVATPAEAGQMNNAADKDLTFYGQVNRNLMIFNDGEETGYRHLDGDWGSTRFGFKGTGKVNESVSMGGRFEVELQSNNPSSIDQNTETGGGTFSHRRSSVFITSKQFGKLTLGQTSSISDGMSDGLDLGYHSGAVAGMDPDLLVSNMKLRNDTTTAAVSSVALTDAFGSLDRGRQDLIRYDTPKFGGAQFMTALYDGGNWGAGVKYNNKFGATKVRVHAFYENLSGTGTAGPRWQAGASAKHDSGISVTGLYGISDPDSGDDHHNWGASVGYTANMNTLGPTGVGVHVTGTENWVEDDTDAIAYGFGLNQGISSAGANIYANVFYWDVDRVSTQTQLDSLVTFMVGGQVKF